MIEAVTNNTLNLYQASVPNRAALVTVFESFELPPALCRDLREVGDRAVTLLPTILSMQIDDVFNSMLHFICRVPLSLAHSIAPGITRGLT